MSLIRLQRNLVKRLPLWTNSFSTAALDNEEYTATPNYPPILDLSPQKVYERNKEAEYEAIKAVKTIEEKQIKLNMPKYYGFKCYMFEESRIPYAQLPLVQFITRTHLIIQDSLPEYYANINVDTILKDIKEDIEEVLLIEYNHYRRKHEVVNEDLDEIERDKLFTQSLIQNLNRTLLNNLRKACPHLLNTQADPSPRIESFWFVGGMKPPDRIRNNRKSQPHNKYLENVPVNRAMQYLGLPILNLRSKLPLLPIIPYSEASNLPSIPVFEYHPEVVGGISTNRHAANIPGFWPGDEYEFGTLSYHNRSHLINRNFNDPTDIDDALNRQGIMSCFGWLNAQANYLGFNTFNDITYPLVTQCVITNGQLWSFYVYQLNTLVNHSQYVTENKKNNVCWATPQMKLFEEIKDGKVIGLNENVLKMLIQYYANVPEERLGVNMRPYLDQQQKVSADYDNDDKRAWLEREYKHLMSNRPRHRLPFELYHWEKIYKVDNKTRPFEARRRPFELNQNPFKRTLDDRQAFYIPRAHRPNVKRHVGRYAKEYFP